MASTSIGLCESADEQCSVALMLIDVINALDFPNAESLLENAIPMADRIHDLKQSARRHRVPVIYVNDNFGRWRSDFRSQVEYCLRPDVLGHRIAERLRPDDSDYFVLKPMHSGFYLTPLEMLLQRLGAKTLILTGMATNICVLFTANEAHMRGFRVVVPADCCAAESEDDHRSTLEQLQKVMSADVRPANRIDFEELLKK